MTYVQSAGKPAFSDHISKTVICYKQKGYTIYVIKQSACLVNNPMMDRGSDSMMAST